MGPAPRDSLGRAAQKLLDECGKTNNIAGGGIEDGGAVRSSCARASQRANVICLRHGALRAPCVGELSGRLSMV
eukprot:8102386-Pyramimonas_sp.AAC.1